MVKTPFTLVRDSRSNRCMRKDMSVNTTLYLAVIVVSAVVVIATVGVGAYLVVNTTSERTDQASLRMPTRPAEEEDTPDSISEAVSLRLSSGESGVLEHDSGARMEVPQGALTESVTVSISEVDPPPGPTRVGRVYDFSVGDSPILAPITLHIPFELEPGTDSSRIVPLHWDEELEVWMVLEGEVEEPSQTVAVTVLDLSWFTASGREALSGPSASAIGLSVQPRIVDVEAPETVVVGEPFDVDWVVQNAGSLDLFQVDEDAVGYVRLLSPTETEGWRREVDSGAPGILGWMGLDWWRVGHSYSSQDRMDGPFTVMPTETGSLTVRVELVFENGSGGVIGRDVMEHEVVVTTHRAIAATTVVVDDREYRVSGEPDSQGMIEYVAEDIRDSAQVSGTLRDQAVFTAYIQQLYRSEGERSYNRAFRRFERAIDFKTYVVVPLADDVVFGMAVSTGVGSILVSPNLFVKGKAAAHLSVDVLLKIIREFTDNAEKVTEEVALQERRWTLELLREKVEITEEVQDGRPLSFAEALRLADGDTYTSVYFPPAEEARQMINRGNQPTPGDALETVAGGLVDQITGSSAVTDAFALGDALSTLNEPSQPLELYGPWRVMTEGIEANMAAERAAYAAFLNSLGISDHTPFQLPVLTALVISDSPLDDQAGKVDEPNVAPAAGRIAFMSYRGDKKEEIYVMDADGMNVTRLTDNEIWEWGPTWSSDGQRITFWAGVDANIEIYEMDADGTNIIQLTNNEEDDRAPSWSPDGRRIAVSSRPDGNWKIYVMDADGTEKTRLTSSEGWVREEEPAWSPDGRRIAFMSTLYGKDEIHVINANGTDETRLTSNDVWDTDPSWSPDGRRIAFASSRDGNKEIYVMDADGTNVTRLTNAPKSDDRPVWSPDGNRIAFESERDGNSEIYVMDADGTNVTRLTNHPASDWSPSWGLVTTSRQGIEVKGLEFRSVSAGWHHTCGLRTDGPVTCWGRNDFGQASPPDRTFASVSSGGFHTCGVTTDDSILCWGRDDDGQSSPQKGEFVSVTSGSWHTCGLRSNGLVACWGNDSGSQSTPPDEDFSSISAGGSHTCGVTADGSVVCWGDGGWYGGGQTPPLDEDFVSVSAGLLHTCGVGANGTVTCWGFDSADQTIPPAEDFASVSAGHDHTCGVTTNGYVLCWGWNGFGQSTPPSGGVCFSQRQGDSQLRVDAQWFSFLLGKR